MRNFEDMQKELATLSKILEKYLRISKMPHDFGVGELLFPSEIHLISTIAVQEKISVTELARQHGTTKGAISQVLGKLEKKGFVIRKTDPEKRSRVHVSVTDKGMTAHLEHYAYHSRHDADFIAYLAALNQNDYQCFSALCEEMNRWMNTYLEQETSDNAADAERTTKAKEQQNAEQADK